MSKLIQETKSISAYRRGLRSAIRALWNELIDVSQFETEVRSLINRRLNEAFDEGARTFGVTPEEYTLEEFRIIAEVIQNELLYVNSLALRILEYKNSGEGITSAFGIIDSWVNRYNDLVNRAKVVVGENEKLIWELGPTEHCSTCSRLAGKVKRSKYWEEHVMPQQPPNPNLECGGWKCQCKLTPTKLPLSKGPLPVYRGKPKRGRRILRRI